MKENIKDTSKYTAVLSLFVLSLFLHIRYTTPFLIVRPFDILTILIFFYMIFQKNKDVEQKLSVGFFYLIPFFIIHFTFAGLIEGENFFSRNFFKELSQVAIFIAVAFILSRFITKIDYKKLIINLLLGSFFIMLFSIFWHLSKGFLVGWKQLPDTRIIFTVLPLLIFAYLNLNMDEKKKKFNPIFILIMFFALTVMSGERKALLIFLFLIVMHYSQGQMLKISLLSLAGYITLFLLADFISNPYLNDKIVSIVSILDTGNFEHYLNTGDLMEKDTFSNVSRVFIFSLSKVYFLENPFFGLGTNNFSNILGEEHYYLPKLFLIGIHNEFQRVLIENGLFGLFFYLLIWYKSWTRTKNIVLDAKKNGLMNDVQYKFCTYSVYFALIIYLGTEATSLRSFVILIFISLLPDYLGHHIKFRKKE